MREKVSTPVKRQPRADAQRNRDRLLEAARQAFTQHGGNAPLDDIARTAGVGAGTLYRHFPTRDHLIEAVFAGEVARLAEAEREFSAKLDPLPALRKWLLLFVDYMSRKLLIAPAMSPEGLTRFYATSRGAIHGGLERLVQRAIKSGDLRKDVKLHDFLLPLIGISHYTQGEEYRNVARRQVDIMLRGTGAK